MSEAIRDALVARLEQDLLGPDKPDEVISDLPSDRYLTGILFPTQSKVSAAEDDDFRGAEGGEDLGGGEDPVGAGLYMALRPASAGLSFAVETDGGRSPTLKFEVACGRYVRLEEGTAGEQDKDKRRNLKWKRSEAYGTATRTLDDPAISVDLKDQVSGLGLYIRKALKDGGHTVTVSAVNWNKSANSRLDDEERAFFQFHLKVTCGTGTRFAPRPSVTVPTDADGRVAELIYRDAREFAVGHTCSASWSTGSDGNVTSVATTWTPRARVYAMNAEGDACFQPLRTDPALKPLSATWLATAADEQLRQGLELVVDAYRTWVDAEEARIPSLPRKLQAQAVDNVKICRSGLARMRDGVALIGANGPVRMAFRLAQQAIVIQRRWLRNEPDLLWRPFQLGFQLLAIESTAKREHPDRATMDLLWFPTGGGKTEAYLALTAFVLFLRRLAAEHPDSGDGVAVLMRYTLRLLTIQQFQRASAMVLACEQMRRGAERPALASGARLGSVPFSIGLWVGGSATPNDFENAQAALRTVGSTSTPRQLVTCPCCGKALSWEARTGAQAIQASCRNKVCALAKGGQDLPVWTVDSDIYRERPSLVIATVDKFAQIARKVQTGSLFGLDRAGALPPDLIIQDELHLISGPLGTMTGLYEVAIDALCTRGSVRPKVIGSTATIRRATEQIRALFDRNTFQFPPPGLDASNSGFAVEDRKRPGRLYVGISTVGRSPKFTLQAACASLLQGASSVPGTEKERDPYWTLVAYFNSLRELGGAVVLMLDDVAASIQQFAARRGEQRRETSEPVELTSRVPSSEIPAILEQLQIACGKAGAIDTLLASNMISVGVDIPRLGVMAVNGQPKTIAEYIQATSRVGRETPGLVVSLYSHGRVRDRSHFESFPNWHATLYREVEATSVTPFASRARDRALPAVLVAMARHLVAGMAQDFKLDAAKRALMAPVVAELQRRVTAIAPEEALGVAAKVRALLDEWQGRKDLAAYWKDDGKTGTLLMSAEQVAAFGAEGVLKRAWAAPNSMREVEPGTPYKLRDWITQRAVRAPGGGDAQ